MKVVKRSIISLNSLNLVDFKGLMGTIELSCAPPFPDVAVVIIDDYSLCVCGCFLFLISVNPLKLFILGSWIGKAQFTKIYITALIMHNVNCFPYPACLERQRKASLQTDTKPGGGGILWYVPSISSISLKVFDKHSVRLTKASYLRLVKYL